MTITQQIIKAYDIRGIVPEQLNEEIAEHLGAAWAALVQQRFSHATAVVIGRDMRESGPALVQAFGRGLRNAGFDVVDIGLASTDELYYASGVLELPGAMFTASHNPAQYNGIKLCGPGASPIGQDTGLGQIREFVDQTLANGLPEPVAQTGTLVERDMLADYAEYVRALVPGLDEIRSLKVVVDAGNGMAGLTAPAVLEALPLEVTKMYYELDGSFPNHEANPIEPENVADLKARVVAEQADLGLAFDGDADRCFVIDEQGQTVNPATLTALIAVRELKRVQEAGEERPTIIHNLITSAAVPEIVAESGGTPVRTRVGHSFIKEEMARTHAVFGGEHSGHFYFRDFWRADSGMLAALHTIAALGTSEGQTLSELLADYTRYESSGEINSRVSDTSAVLDQVKAAFVDRDGCEVDELDGFTVRGESESGDLWWFNVRASNTEPLLRLNVEAATTAAMEQVRDEVLAVIRGE